MDIEISNSLDSLTLDSYGHSMNLKKLARLVGIKPVPKRKAEIIQVLSEAYEEEGFPEKLYGKLSSYEKALLTCIVQSQYQPMRSELQEIANSHDFKIGSSWYSSYQFFFPKDSMLYAFFIDGYPPQLFRDYFASIIPAYEVQFQEETPNFDDDYVEVAGRSERIKDFDLLLSFVNNQSVTATKAGGYMSKPALLKFQQLAGYIDPCNSDTGEIKDIRNASETIISMGLVNLLKSADVIDTVNNKFILSKQASHFAGLSMLEKAQFLYERYLRAFTTELNECERIIYPKLKFSKKYYNLTQIRKKLIEYLTLCPVGKWVSFSKFSKEIRKLDPSLFVAVGDVFIRDEYHNDYYNRPSWNEFEYYAISVILMEYLGTLGVVDVLADTRNRSEYDYDKLRYEVIYFQITSLGAYLLGMSDTYEPAVAQNTSDNEGLIVQPNFDVMIMNGVERLQHELFFDRFAIKTVDDEQVAVYKLDFKGMVEALNIGMHIREIESYCESFSQAGMPSNVKEAFADWEEQSKRIRIRTVSIIEADDPYLLEEIQHYRGMKNLIEPEGMKPVIILQAGAEKKVKAQIEKNKRFCTWRLL